MAATLQQLGAFVFLDRSSLRPGRSWKQQLRSAIMDSNVFVVIMDANAARRAWIVAEFMTAYRIKVVKRSPEIFVIHPADMDFSAASTPASALFNELMVLPSRPIPNWMRSRMAAFDHDTALAMCRAIRNYPISGVLGFQANRFLSLILQFVVPIGGVVEFFSVPIFILIASKPGVLTDNPNLVLPFAFANTLRGAFGLRWRKTSGILSAPIFRVLLSSSLPSHFLELPHFVSGGFYPWIFFY